MSSFRGKVALVTGSSSGIGAQTAVLFAKGGASVVLTARREDRLQETAQLCKQAGLGDEQILVVPADVTVEGDVQNLIRRAFEKFGRLDILVNNAGALMTGSLLTITSSDVDKMYRINVGSLVHITQCALPHIAQSQGNIINVSSITGIRAATGAAAYSMSKAAVDNFSRSLAVELAPKGVRVNSVNPSYVNTDIFQSFVPEKDYPTFMTKMASTHPIERLATTQEVAHTIVFLASDDAAYVTGANVPMDGGKLHTMMSPKTPDPSQSNMNAPWRKE